MSQENVELVRSAPVRMAANASPTTMSTEPTTSISFVVANTSPEPARRRARYVVARRQARWAPSAAVCRSPR
jgi:uncharacterized protein (DUF2126 family)